MSNVLFRLKRMFSKDKVPSIETTYAKLEDKIKINNKQGTSSSGTIHRLTEMKEDVQKKKRGVPTTAVVVFGLIFIIYLSGSFISVTRNMPSVDEKASSVVEKKSLLDFVSVNIKGSGSTQHTDITKEQEIDEVQLEILTESVSGEPLKPLPTVIQ